MTGERDLDSVREARGYLLPLHEVLASHDPNVLSAYEGMMQALYLGGRLLDGKTKELIYVAVLIALASSEEHIVAHMRKAVREGATQEEVMQTIELLLPAAGVARANTGFDLWRKTFAP